MLIQQVFPHWPFLQPSAQFWSKFISKHLFRFNSVLPFYFFHPKQIQLSTYLHLVPFLFNKHLLNNRAPGFMINIGDSQLKSINVATPSSGVKSSVTLSVCPPVAPQVIRASSYILINQAQDPVSMYHCVARSQATHTYSPDKEFLSFAALSVHLKRKELGPTSLSRLPTNSLLWSVAQGSTSTWASWSVN